jgi:Na+-translocating ferredoxin:NAD+ oxidoreductase subunit G
MKNTFKLSFILFIVCVIAGGILAVVYKYTKDIIKRNEADIKINSIKGVIPNIDRVMPYKGNENILIAYDMDGNDIGKVCIVNTKGYSGPIEFIMGVDSKGHISGMQVISQSETPGLGTQITNDTFLKNFLGLNKDEIFLKKDNAKGKIDAITGATISSRAITESARKSLSEVFNKVVPEYRDGIYEIKSRGHSGVMQVKVFIRNSKIYSIEASAPYETKSSWEKIYNSLTPEIIRKQSVDEVNTVTGATVSSQAYLDAVKFALEESTRKK